MSEHAPVDPALTEERIKAALQEKTLPGVFAGLAIEIVRLHDRITELEAGRD